MPVTAQTLKQIPNNQQQLTLSFAPLVKQTAKSVVNIYAERRVERRSPFGGDPFFEQFFGQVFPHRSEKQSSLGSGVVIDASGIVITNYHVIEGADEVKIAFADGREFASNLLLKDKRVDLAVLQIRERGEYPALNFGNSDRVEVGDLVLAIGNPFGVGQTVTSGIISALARNQVGVSDFGSFIQTDAAINPGNSGGALIDMNGQLIGINTAIFSRSGGSNGIGFAIPVNMVRAVVQSALSGSAEFERPFLGASFDMVTPDIAEALGLSRARGALVTSIIADGPADLAGLRAGDIVLALDQQQIIHPDELGYRLATAGIGSIVELGVYRGGQNRQINVKLGAPPSAEELQTAIIEGRSPFTGAKVAELTPWLAGELGLAVNRQGLVILEITRGSRAQRYGFQPGDLITKVSGDKLTKIKQLQEIVSAGASFWRLEIIRNGQTIRQILR